MLNPDSVTIEIRQDPDISSVLSSEELQQITRAIASQLKPKVDSISLIDTQLNGLNSSTTSKGTPSSSILDIQINLDTLKSFGSWFYDRLVGTPTKVVFKYKDFTCILEGLNEKGRAAAISDFERFIALAKEHKGEKNGQ